MKGISKDTAIAVGIILLLGLIYVVDPLHTHSWDPRLRVYGVSVFRMPSASMKPTLRENSVFIVSAWPYVWLKPRAGDIVVFRFPLNPSVTYLKRIVATGGSSIEISKGVVRVDGKPLVESYLVAEESSSDYAREMPIVRIPAGSYFVMGDNRDNSTDSRTWGFLPRDNIMGKVGPVLIGGAEP